jgi:hypothetical protein
MSNKKYCSKCRLDIDKKAKKCPYCGKRQYGNGIYIFLGILMCMGILAFIFDNDPESDTAKTSEPLISTVQTSEPKAEGKSDEKVYIQITSTELIDQFNNNSVKCKQLYDGELLEVTGKVQSVGEDILGNTYVCLGHDTDFTFVGIQCYAKNEAVINKISELKENDIIIVQGKGDFNSLSFTLEDADIID